MIKTLLHISWLNLKRDGVALFLTFVLPIAFFSIFAMIFGGMGGGGGGMAAPLDALIVDLDDSKTSRAYVESLATQSGINISTELPETDEELSPLDGARLAVRQGGLDAAVVIPEGFGESFGFFGDMPTVDLIYDGSNPMSQHGMSGLLQASAMTAAPSALVGAGIAQLEQFGGPLTGAQKTATDAFIDMLDTTDADLADGGDGDDGGGGFSGLVDVHATEARDVEADKAKSEKQGASMIAYYAAGIGVMFLLFSMAGAAGSLLEEEESGTFQRLLSSNVGMGTILASKWLFFSIVGALQLVIMFVFGAFVFGLDLWSPPHLAGFLALTPVTAAAAAAFGIVLATICRTRAQLSGLSTIVILVMSALGGSMAPRFIMPDFMNMTAKFTFNGWAIDGFLDIFWFDDPNATISSALGAISLELVVMAAMAVAFLVIARHLARRWEAV